MSAPKTAVPKAPARKSAAASRGPAPIKAPTTLPPLVAHCMELLGELGPVRQRRMFGGWGFYIDGHFVAILAWDRLYLKTHQQTQPAFEAEGCQPFIYDGKGKPMQMSYFTAPDEAMDSPALMRPWAQRALDAALAAAAATRKPTSRSRTAAVKSLVKPAVKTASKRPLR